MPEVRTMSHIIHSLGHKCTVSGVSSEPIMSLTIHSNNTSRTISGDPSALYLYVVKVFTTSD